MAYRLFSQVSICGSSEGASARVPVTNLKGLVSVSPSDMIAVFSGFFRRWLRRQWLGVVVSDDVRRGWTCRQ